MKRWLFLIYGVVSHLLFLGLFAYMVGFMGNFLVPKSIDSPTNDSTGTAVVINLLLMGLFAVQHSVMARPAFKRAWTQIVPKPIERSTYVMISNIVTICLMWQWRGMGAVVWNIETPTLRTAAWALFATGWLLVPLVSLMIDHFDLFGTRQVWLYFRSRDNTPLPFRTPLLYGKVRHPLYLGWALAFWATPTMSAGHLLFAGVMTGYMVMAAVIEERDLIAHFGSQYSEYRRRVPMFIPRLRHVATESSESAEVVKPESK